MKLGLILPFIIIIMIIMIILEQSTLMLLIVVAVFLIVELPLAILFVILIVQNTFQAELIKPVL